MIDLLQDISVAPVIRDLPPYIRGIRLHQNIMLAQARPRIVRHLADYSLGYNGKRACRACETRRQYRALVGLALFKAFAHVIDAHFDFREHAPIGEGDVGPRMSRVINGNNLSWIHKRLLSCLRSIAPMLDLKKSHFSPLHEPAERHICDPARAFTFERQSCAGA